MSKHQPIVRELKRLLKNNEGWGILLVDSLTEAGHKASEAGMDTRAWPTDLDSYYNFLDEAVQLIPRQDYPRETFNVLAKFYWLLDQPPGKKLQESDAFNKWMHDFALEWGAFLNTPASGAGVETYRNDPAYNVWQYDEPPGGWTTFNDFFTRQVRPGLRPVAGMTCDQVVVNAADCTFKSKAKITATDKVTFKHTHTYSIPELLEGSPYAEAFAGGLYMHSFLGPADYHRFRAPVRGTVLESRAITGRVFLQVVIKPDGTFDAPDDADNGYEFVQKRGLLIIDSPVGLVAVIPIGMAQVSSVNMTAVEGGYLEKGGEFGYFAFGGSDMIILFQKDSGIEVTAAPGVHFNACQAIAEVIR